MKKWKVVLTFFVATVVLASVVRAEVLDPMTQGLILDPSRDPLIGPGRWHDERDWQDPILTNTSYLKDSAFSHDGDGSMMIDYSYWSDPELPPPNGDPYDRVPRGYFEPGNGTYDPGLGDLTGLRLSFWWYKANTDGPEAVREIQIYSPDGCTGIAVANGGQSIPVGWYNFVTEPITAAGWDWMDGALDPTNITTIDFWVSCWGDNWYEGQPPEEWEQIMPTGSPVYIDDLQVIPEPATMIMLGLGGLALLRRRKA